MPVTAIDCHITFIHNTFLLQDLHHCLAQFLHMVHVVCNLLQGKLACELRPESCHLAVGLLCATNRAWSNISRVYFSTHMTQLCTYLA